ncbi:hypothetical protein CU086_00040 [Candidatus Nasuia deltocephalinicola]|uniref:Uncharacterized protein n=1 Tax=Candidatus Nasuia deltocephalincola TaxID=1160784 RepID=A0A974WMT8_9PROT|nr:hypothetical protein CU086_00040 [Candidatus Nasuia deltocephalinicola]
MIENNNFSKSEILNIKLFIKKKTWKIKKIENKYFISITKLLKLFNIIEINKLKLDLIKII